MRYVFGFMCVCALGVMGCSETAGTGGNGGVGGDGGSAGSGGVAGTGGSAGSGGVAGTGGSAGSGGSAGTGGMGGSGGTGGMGGVGGSGGASLCDGVTCADTECKIDGVCDADDGLCDYTLVEDGTACSLGECLNGVCAGAITVACGDNVQGCGEICIGPFSPVFRFDLQVEPGPIVAGNSFTAELTGVAHVPEFWVLAFFNGYVCGGVRTIELIDLAATVSVRSGATGADVTLGIDLTSLSPGATSFCNFPPDQTCTVNDDCLGTICNPPVLLQDLPVIDGIPLSPGGCDADTSNCPIPGPPPDCDCSACDALGAVKAAQCSDNGFCVNGDVLLPLDKRTGNYIADPVSGTPILFGWFDGNPPPTNPDGTIQLPAASFANPVPPIGIRVAGIRVKDGAEVLPLPLQCLMGVDSGGPYGIGIPDQASPTPDSLLITFSVP